MSAIHSNSQDSRPWQKKVLLRLILAVEQLGTQDSIKITLREDPSRILSRILQTFRGKIKIECRFDPPQTWDVEIKRQEPRSCVKTLRGKIN